MSLVVCTRHRPDQLRNCLEAISRLDPGPSDVLVIDNTEGDHETRNAAFEFGARYLVEPLSGLSRARNRAMAECSSDCVAFVDDDALPATDWLARLLEPFGDPNVAAATGDTYDPKAAPGKPVEKPARLLDSKKPLWFEIASFGGLGFGTNMVLRKSSCPDSKIFDERLGRGAPFWIAEENHAFASLIAQGYCVAHVPAAIVIHPTKPQDIRREAATSFAYWLFLFFEFPGHKLDLLRFLTRRLQRKKLPWPRDPQEPGEVINSGWRTQIMAAFEGLLIYIRNRKPRSLSNTGCECGPLPSQVSIRQVAIACAASEPSASFAAREHRSGEKAEKRKVPY